MIVRTLVGVENSRRVMPSWRVVISTAAPVMLVRNMNRMTWLSAPTAKPFGFAVTSLTDSTVTPTPATADWRSRAAASAASNETPVVDAGVASRLDQRRSGGRWHRRSAVRTALA